MFEAFVLKVLISTPGDTEDEVAAIMEGLHGWNGSRAEAARVILLPRHWKSDAVPRLGAAGGQGIINEQLVDDADIVIAVFDSRLGQATAAAVSGTAEEIQRAVDAGKHVHVWFSSEPIKRDADLEQLAALRKFQQDLQDQGLLGQYANLADLAFRVRAAIEDDLAQMGLDAPGVRRSDAEHAMPRAQRVGNDLVIINRNANVTAEQLKFTVAGVWPASWGDMDDGDNEPVHLMYDGEPVDLLPASDISWPMMVFGQSPPQINVTMSWIESGKPYEVSQTIAL